MRCASRMNSHPRCTCVPDAHASRMHTHPGCTRIPYCALMAAAQCNPDINRRERGRTAAPAAALRFLKCKRLFNPQSVRHREAVPGRGRGFGFSRFQIPAGAGAARCDRTADRKGRENDHFNLGRHLGALRLDLTVNLEHPADREEIVAAIWPNGFPRHTGRRRRRRARAGPDAGQKFAWDRPWLQ